MSTFVGEIRAFAGNFVPEGWYACDGALLPVSQHTTLYSLIGNIYGGTPNQTFNLPDLRGRVPAGIGQMPGGSLYTLGEQGGIEVNTLSVNQLPAHNHTAAVTPISIGGSVNASINVNNASNDSGEEPNGAYLGKSDGTALYASSSDGSALAADSISVDSSGLQVSQPTTSIGMTGAGQTIENRQPFLGIMWIINYDGVYPNRS
ncbi:tail fiber protein [Flavobacteriaceae bacterium S356]|uniref:Tail fiber protein n=1 Tax=Asprobacillus argus TaxID=3076534 RepID=A0ABU3LGY7_9FLAO|nr:tail fiber protein [Flavobacteriaceae bacterium S356]